MNKILLLILSILLSLTVTFGQNQIISGVVISSQDKEPVIGASVVLKDNPSVGARTNIDGKFSFTAPVSAKFVKISYIGMITKEVIITPNMHIELELDNRTLNEVVVVGMTKVDKRLFTGASTKVDGEKAKLDGVADAARALEGKAAGVSVQNVSGTFGSAPKIRIRGATSIYGSSKPLWVVDGVVMDDVVDLGPDDLSSGDAATLISNAIAGINPDDIASFQVLKDGSATSIYGARAMAGVIVITTKKGRSGFSKITYTGEYTYRMKPSYNNFNLMNSQEQLSVYREMEKKGLLNLASVANSASSGIYGKMYDLINQGKLINDYEHKASFLRGYEYKNTDWFDILFKNSIMNTHSVSITSGTDKASYYASLSAMLDPGWTLQSKVNRYTANFNTTYKLTSKLNFSMIANAAYRQQRAPGTLTGEVDQVNGKVKRDFDINPFSYALNTSRLLSPDDFYRQNYAAFNIKHELDNNYMDFTVFDLKYQAEIKWKAFKGFELSALGDVKYNNSRNDHYITEFSNQSLSYRAMQTSVIQSRNPFLYSDPDKPNDLPVSILPQGGFYNTNNYSLKAWDFRLSATYNKSFYRHILNLFGGMEINSIDRQTSGYDGYGMQYSQGETVFFEPLAFKKLKENGANYFYLRNSRYRNAAFFANTTYNYDGRYTLNATIRYEGTNKMGKSRKVRWLPTWNVSGSWNVSNEEFYRPMKDYMNNLRLKASYSLTADKGPDFINNSTAIYRANTIWRNPSAYQESAISLFNTENKDLTYEKKHELNIGLDASFLNDRISMSLDWYRRDNFDLIAQTVTQGLSGIILQYGNVASMKSSGVELSVNITNVKTKDFTWNTDFVYAHATNEITDFFANSSLINMVAGGGFARKGYPVRAIFSIPFAGLTRDGLPSFYKADGTTTITDINFQERQNLDYLKYSGSADPTDFGSLGNTLRYKNWNFNVFLTYSMGNVVRLDPVFASTYSDLSAMPKEFKNRWADFGDEKITNIPTIVSLRKNYDIPNLSQAYNAYNFSDVRIAKGDFIRLKEISIAYNVPNKWLKSLNISELSLKLQATNLLLLYSDSKLNGADPEFINTGGVATPLPRQFTFTLRMGI